jgi:hypothetical protein
MYTLLFDAGFAAQKLYEQALLGRNALDQISQEYHARRAIEEYDRVMEAMEKIRGLRSENRDFLKVA